MILSKTDLRNYLNEDKKFYQATFADYVLKRQEAYIVRYLYHLRHAEYYLNNSGRALSHRILKGYHTYKMRALSYKLGFQIGLNTCGPGIIFYHFGHIIINGKARIGKNLCVYPGVTIGQNERGEAPRIGDNCFLGLGSKVLGNVRIGNNVVVAANSVVTKDVPDNCMVAGVPAVIVKKRENALNFLNTI
ncbi:serine O-acetyltransferase [Dyadobacter fermentans]|uniref:Transferase hexapeptide repeat containing protein n=1 Tax=Dyadobacter fermentans (strain ATCC 700827 / DSM 18053 / CIP 107007 / KCTC 52180 / NS114) TaxID=471854 RepID=C6VUM0_DYAFD|nr:DapH/DapD/GlmU-related protein [Dyadobacter fermentans]ACT91329.1 transferase hexapeptide repeat containing protein [Dyadobacter fermentans DSM 18053]